MNFEEKAEEILKRCDEDWSFDLTKEVADALREAYELGRSELNAHDKSRLKVLLEKADVK